MENQWNVFQGIYGRYCSIVLLTKPLTESMMPESVQIHRQLQTAMSAIRQGSTLTRARVPGAHKFCGRARELLNSRARPGKCFFRTVKQFAAMSLVVCRLPARCALKTKEIPVTVSAHVIHYGISEGSNTSLITFPTWCACVNPIVIDLIDVKFCDLSRNGGCLHPDYHNVSHQNVTLPSRRKVADTI